MTEIFQGIGGSIYMIVGTLVGLRLLVRGARGRLLPESLLGLSFVLAGTVGAPLEVMGDVLAQQAKEGRSAFALDAVGWAGPLLSVGKAITIAGLSAYVVFVWRVFRSDAGWAVALAAALIGIQVVAWLGFWHAGAFRSGENAGPWFWLELGARVAAPSWAIAEFSGYHERMRKRMRIGLADPLLVDRFRLWALAAACGLVMMCSSLPPKFLARDHWVLLSGLPVLVFAASGVVSSAAYWIACFPPTWYARRVRAQAGV